MKVRVEKKSKKKKSQLSKMQIFLCPVSKEICVFIIRQYNKLFFMYVLLK